MPRTFICLLCSGVVTLTLTASALAGDVSLDHVVMTNGVSTLSLPHVVLSDTNLSQDEAKTLFSNASDPQARKALLFKLKARKIIAPTLVEVYPQGRATITGVEIDDVEAGRAGRAFFAGGEFSADEKGRGAFAANLGSIHAEGLDLSPLILGTDSAADLRNLRTDHMSWTGFSASIPVPVRQQSAGAPSQNAPIQQTWKMGIGDLDVHNSYAGDIPVSTSTSLQRLTLEPPPASAAAHDLKQFGYDGLDFTITADATYDPAAELYSFKDVSIKAAQMGRITMEGSLGSVTKAFVEGSPSDRAQAIVNSDLLTLKVSVVNGGLFDKILARYAAQKNLDPDAVRQQWAAAAQVMIPLFLQGAPSSSALAQAVGAFIQSSNTLNLNIKSKGKGVRIGDLEAPGRAGVLSRLDIDATATN